MFDKAKHKRINTDTNSDPVNRIKKHRNEIKQIEKT